MRGFLSKLFSRAETRFQAIGGPMYALHGGMGAVPQHLSESLSAVVSCVELIAGAIASLPVSLTVDTPSGRAPAPQTAPAWRLLTRPNALQSWPAWASWTAASLLLHGNALSLIRNDARGAPTGLMPAPWPWLLPQVIGGGDGPRLAFDMMQASPESTLLGLPRRMLDTDVLHIRARSDHGAIGRSVLARSSAPVREGLEIATLAQANWANGMRPSALISMPNFLDDTRRKRFEEETLAKFSGALNAGKIPVLEGGWKFEQISINSVDAEFLATRQFSVAEICRIFCVPEPLLQLGQRVPADLSPYTAAFCQQAILPLVRLIQSEFNYSVLPPGMYLELDTDHLARGSFSATVAGLAALKQSAIITANDARAELGWPPVAGGDALSAAAPPSWPADGPGSVHLAPSPGPTGNGPPEPGNHSNEGKP
jgi:HK97 family phage portal protein